MAVTVAIVTARNEADRIQATLAGLARAFPGAPVWVADDGSRDATAELARASGARVVRSERARGKGQAATDAALRALEALGEERAGAGEQGGRASDATVVVLCDGDLGESAAQLGALVAAVRGRQGGLAVAAFRRRVGGGLGIALCFARWAIERRCGVRARAPISGQRALPAAALRQVLPFASGFGMEVGMTIDAARAGYGLVEIELDLEHRATGRTPAGFVHRARQLADIARAYAARR